MNLNPELLESVNAAIFILFSGAVLVLVWYLLRELRAYGYVRYRAQAAVSLLTIFSGEAVKSGIIWWVRSRANEGLPADWLVDHQNWFIGLGAALLVFGPLCYIRIWSPAHLGEWPWVSTGLVALALAVGGLIPALCTGLFLGIVFFFSRRRVPPG